MMINKTTKTLAITCFILVLSALVSALISDAIVVGQAILGFILALVVAVVAFIVGVFLMIISCILIFGIYLLENDGFWPIIWAESAFKDVMKDYQITNAQIDILFTIRIILLVICVAVFIMSIIALSYVKKVKKQDKIINRKPTLGFATTSLVLSILGVLACIGVLVVLTIAR